MSLVKPVDVIAALGFLDRAKSKHVLEVGLTIGFNFSRPLQDKIVFYNPTQSKENIKSMQIKTIKR